ncbi:MAG: RNA-binding protein [Eubacterium sp.]|nr:RNA-binding protein [Eubacterium sp.]
MDEKRFNELYNRAYSKSYRVFSDFLNLEEQSILATTYLPCSTYGGYDMSERIVAGFGENIENTDFPIKCLVISPVMQKFADKLTHRDFLGALMNLGIKREMLGDIIINDNCGYLFCLDHISEYIKNNLNRIKHTNVNVTECDSLPANIIKAPDPRELIISSLRLDVLVSAVYKLSRNEASKLFSTGKVFVNSKLIETTSYQIKENDIISVRDYGRFTFSQQLRKTKKDRLVVEIVIFL